MNNKRIERSPVINQFREEVALIERDLNTDLSTGAADTNDLVQRLRTVAPTQPVVRALRLGDLAILIEGGHDVTGGFEKMYREVSRLS